MSVCFCPLPLSCGLRSPSAVAQLLYGSGDAREPLPETMRVLDEIATEFIQSLSFEATRAAHYAGRQKVKYDDFEFALRRNPMFLGKVREMFEMSKDLKEARKMPRRHDRCRRLGQGRPGGAGEDGRRYWQRWHGRVEQAGKKKRNEAEAAEEELGEQDDDIQAEMDALGRKK